MCKFMRMFEYIQVLYILPSVNGSTESSASVAWDELGESIFHGMFMVDEASTEVKDEVGSWDS